MRKLNTLRPGRRVPVNTAVSATINHLAVVLGIYHSRPWAKAEIRHEARLAMKELRAVVAALA